MKTLSETARRSKAMPLKDAIDAFMKSFGLELKFNETYIPAYWEKIMGKMIATRTKEIYVKNNILYLRIESAPLKNELFMAKTKVIELVNKEVGEKIVEDVVFL